MDLLNYIPQCGSTNDEILSLWERSPKNFLTLYTFCQTNGRGQYGNVWQIQPEQNLAFSFVMKEKSIKLPFEYLNFYTANILREFIAKKTESEVQIKWPNDIILRNKKIAGMLIERKKIGQEWLCIIGVGVNVLQENFTHLPKAGSVFTQVGRRFDLHEWAKEMHYYFIEKFEQNLSEEKILRQYQDYLFKREQVAVFNIKGVRQNGIIRQVDKEGYLWVKLAQDGLRKFYHKEIEMEY